MPTKIEKDIISGQETTGHEWDGVKELNRPLPKWWLYVFIATIIYSVGQFVIYPSWPGISGYLRGTAGWSQRGEVEEAVAAVARQRAGYMDKIAALPFDQIRADGQLYNVALTAGRIAFANNCQPCHGANGTGSLGYPVLGDDVWLWGGSYDEIQKTIAYGIRSDHAQTRSSQMPAFGAVLKPEELDAVTDHVMALYGTPTPGANVALGNKVYEESNCAACHGDKGQGNAEQGGPRLASKVHLYGADRASVRAQIANARMGMMPAWNTRLDAATIKALTMYVHQLGGGQ